MKVLGIDVGGVIISREGDGGDTSFFSDNYLKTPPSDKVFEVLARIVPEFDDTVIISKCGKKVQEKTELWMYHHNFAFRTGIMPSKFYFCRERSEKAGIARELGVTHYIDDREDILRSMIGIVPHLFLFDPLREARRSMFKQFDRVTSWLAFEQRLQVLDRR